MELLKKNRISIVLGLVAIFLAYKVIFPPPQDDMVFKVAEKAIKEHEGKLVDSICKLNDKLVANQLVIDSDSIERATILKKYTGHYENNLSHSRLIGIRDSLRANRHDMSHRYGIQ